MSEIAGPGYRLSVSILTPFPDEKEGPTEDTAPGFLAWWTKEASLRGVPSPRYTGSDYGIARRLLQKHGLNRLKELALHFLRRHADPLTKGYPRHMVLFNSKISTIEQELKDQA